MILQVFRSIRIAFKCRDYKPKPLSLLTGNRWMNQFDKDDRELAGRLLDNVIYISENRTKEILVQQNAELMQRLSDAGLPPKKLVYVQVHDAGSSSPVMLNLLRDAANLEKRGCRFVDAHDSLRLNHIMNELGEGALIYVDDFVGTGNQFCTERDFAAQSFVGSFSEFILAPSICEEALELLNERGIQAFSGHLHSKEERPLHKESTIFNDVEKQRLTAACSRVARFGLGYKGLATMVVLYRTAPNTIPIIFRGNVNQTNFKGIFPRYMDLPLG